MDDQMLAIVARGLVGKRVLSVEREQRPTAIDGLPVALTEGVVIRCDDTTDVAIRVDGQGHRWTVSSLREPPWPYEAA